MTMADFYPRGHVPFYYNADLDRDRGRHKSNGACPTTAVVKHIFLQDLPVPSYGSRIFHLLMLQSSLGLGLCEHSPPPVVGASSLVRMH